jgi:hypothetical protein
MNKYPSNSFRCRSLKMATSSSTQEPITRWHPRSFPFNQIGLWDFLTWLAFSWASEPRSPASRVLWNIPSWSPDATLGGPKQSWGLLGPHCQHGSQPRNGATRPTPLNLRLCGADRLSEQALPNKSTRDGYCFVTLGVLWPYGWLLHNRDNHQSKQAIHRTYFWQKGLGYTLATKGSVSGDKHTSNVPWHQQLNTYKWNQDFFVSFHSNWQYNC